MDLNPNLIEAIFDRQGIAPENRDIGQFFFDKAPEESAHAGAYYAIPRELYKGEPHPHTGENFGPYILTENGAIVSFQTRVANPEMLSLGRRAIVDAYSIDGETTISANAVVKRGAKIAASRIGARSVMGEFSEVYASRIESGVTIGSNARIHNSVIKVGTTTEKRVFINYAYVGADNILEEKATILGGAKTGVGVTLGENSRVEPGAHIGSGSYVMPGQVVKEKRWIRPQTIVVPQKYRRSTSSNGTTPPEKISLETHRD